MADLHNTATVFNWSDFYYCLSKHFPEPYPIKKLKGRRKLCMGEIPQSKTWGSGGDMLGSAISRNPWGVFIQTFLCALRTNR